MNRKLKSKFYSILFCSAALFCISMLSSCQKIMGYSILLWNVPEYNLSDGTIVPVYIKSNVSHVYVIGLPDSEEKIEVALWQITQPQKKKKTEQLSEKYNAYAHTYARCVLDGLPIRQDRVNTSKQVYRLRKGEVIRTLYEAEGVAVMTGKNAMEGKWLRVVTDSGIQGWCFSYNLRLFQMNADGTIAGGAEEADVEQKDEVLERMLSKKWYPESYSTMIRNGNIDFEEMQVIFGFFVNEDSKTVSMELPKISESSSFKEITKPEEYVYRFSSSPFQVTIRNSNFIVVQFTGEDGKPVSYNFVSLDTDIAKILDDESERRAEVYKQICDFGPDFKSTNYGTLTLEEDNSFKWINNRLLVPAVITASAEEEGIIQIKYFLSSELRKTWDGVLTFHFGGMENEVNFLYKMEKNGLRLEDATRSEMRSNYIMSRAQNATVMFFAK